MALVRTSESIQIWRRRHDERERQQDLERERRQAEQRRRNLEEKRVSELQRQVKAWEFSRRVRSYLEACYKSKFPDGMVPSGPSLPEAEWMEWVVDYAGRIDPFT